jgi:hypothetical protein
MPVPFFPTTQQPQELPQDRVALDYVCERAREFDATVSLEKCRQALGALGLTGSMALQTIGASGGRGDGQIERVDVGFGLQGRQQRGRALFKRGA